MFQNLSYQCLNHVSISVIQILKHGRSTYQVDIQYDFDLFLKFIELAHNIFLAKFISGQKKWSNISTLEQRVFFFPDAK